MSVRKPSKIQRQDYYQTTRARLIPLSNLTKFPTHVKTPFLKVSVWKVEEGKSRDDVVGVWVVHLNNVYRVIFRIMK